MFYQFFIWNPYRGQSFYHSWLWNQSSHTLPMASHLDDNSLLGIFLSPVFSSYNHLHSSIIFSSKWAAGACCWWALFWQLSLINKTCVRTLAMFLSFLFQLENKRMCGCLIIYFIVWFIWALYCMPWCGYGGNVQKTDIPRDFDRACLTQNLSGLLKFWGVYF